MWNGFLINLFSLSQWQTTNKSTILALSFLMIGCSTKVTTTVTNPFPPLDANAEVVVVGLFDSIPMNAIDIGSLKIDDNGFSVGCGWKEIIEDSKVEARRKGGNILKISKHLPPDNGYSCHRFKFKIYKIDSQMELDSIKKSIEPKVDSNWNYAKIYMYRLDGMASLVNYRVHIADSTIFKAKVNSKTEILIPKEGKCNLWANTEVIFELPLDIEFGKEYFVKCDVGVGMFFGHPKLKLVNYMQGESEYSSIKIK